MRKLAHPVRSAPESVPRRTWTVFPSVEAAKAGFGRNAVFPRIPGHEIVGDVVAVSSAETKWKAGERVGGGWHRGHCSECSRCRAGDFITCENEDINSE